MSLHSSRWVIALPLNHQNRRSQSDTAQLQSGARTNLGTEIEIELARGLITGDAETFDRFVAHFQAKIFRYSWLICGQQDDAKEVAQQTPIGVFENVDQLLEPERVRP